jgi:hypothetical protein
MRWSGGKEEDEVRGNERESRKQTNETMIVSSVSTLK